MHTFSMPGGLKVIRKEIPQRYLPSTKPPFFSYMLAREPEKRAEIVEKAIERNKKKGEKCKKIPIAERLKMAKRDLALEKTAFGVGIFAASGLLNKIMGFVPALAPAILIGQIGLMLGAVAYIMMNAEELITSFVDGIFGPDPRKEDKAHPDYWYDFRLGRAIDSANKMVREKARRIDERMGRG